MMTEPQQYLVDSNGKKTGVILSLKHYQQLLEDVHDLAIVAERRDEDTRSLQELRQRLEEDELL
jgi:PHD/YefM family antitoxin component YafN of YafNO toxin-antitoxin module